MEKSLIECISGKNYFKGYFVHGFYTNVGLNTVLS